MVEKLLCSVDNSNTLVHLSKPEKLNSARCHQAAIMIEQCIWVDIETYIQQLCVATYIFTDMAMDNISLMTSSATQATLLNFSGRNSSEQEVSHRLFEIRMRR